MKQTLMNATAIATGFALIGAAAPAQSIDTSEVMVEGDQVTFSSVTAEQDGYLVIHAVQDGETVVPESIGHTAISAGENADVTVTTNYPVVEGENYVAMLHVESNDNDTYDFGPGNTDVDTPVTMDGEIVTSMFSGSGTADMGMEEEAAAETQTMNDMELPADVAANIEGWPQASVDAAMEMVAKYGAPDEMTETLLIWRDNGPFVRTYVYGYEIDHNWPAPHKDVLEQFIHYDVPEDVFDELAMFDGSIIAERTKGEISARCHAEFANLIALNLANDVITGAKSVEEARDAYVEAVRAHMAGNTPEIAQRLTFEPAQEDVTNPGEAVIEQ